MGIGWPRWPSTVTSGPPCAPPSTCRTPRCLPPPAGCSGSSGWCPDRTSPYQRPPPSPRSPPTRRRCSWRRWRACTCSTGPRRTVTASTTSCAATPSTWLTTRRPKPNGARRARGCCTTTCTPRTAWLAVEESNLVAAVADASERGPQPAVWLLADTLRGYFALRRSFANWQVAAQAGLAAATAAGDLWGQAAAQLSLAELEYLQERHRQAIDHYNRSLNVARRCGWRDGEAAGLNNLAVVHSELGPLQQAIDHYHLALAVNQQTGFLGGQASNHSGLAAAYGQMGRLVEALEHHTEALALARKLGSRSSEANDLVNTAETLHALGRPDHALDNLDQAIRLHRQAGYGGEAYALRLLAAIHCDLGRYAEALDHARAACYLARQIGRGRVEADALGVRATIHHHLGQHEQALEQVQHALRLNRDCNDRYTEARLLIGLAVARRHLGQHELALDHAQDALHFTRQHGYRMLEGVALTVLAGCRLERDERAEAGRLAVDAVAVQRETGYRLGKARALLLLGQASADPARYWTAALDLFTAVQAPEAGQVRSLLASVGATD